MKRPSIMAVVAEKLAEREVTSAPEPANDIEGLHEAMAINGMGARRVFILDRQAGSVKAVDAETYSVVDEVAVGARPTELALTPDQSTLLVTVTGSRPLSNVEDGTLAFLSVGAGSLALSANIPLGYAPWGVVLTSDGSKAYVSDAGAAAVYVVDVPMRSRVATILSPFLDTPQGLDISPDDLFLYVANVAFVNEGIGLPKAPENVTVISTITNAVTAAVDVSDVVEIFGPWDVTVLPGGGLAYTNDGDNGRNIYQIDADPSSATFNQVTNQLDLGTGGEGPRGMESGITFGGVRVFAALAESNEVVAIDPVASQVVGRVAVDSPWRVRLNPEGTELWVSSQNGVVLVLDANTLQEIATVTGFGQPADIVFELPLPTPEERIDQLRNSIENLEAAGIINQGQAQALFSKTDGAAAQLVRGNDKAAANALGALIHHIEAFVQAGIVTEDEAQPLLDAAHDAISQLEAEEP